MLVPCHDFAECGPNSTVAQMNTFFDYTRGTLRGLHPQMPPYAEAKLVRCTRGAIVDVEDRPKPQTVCRTRLSYAGQRDGSHLQVSGPYKPAGQQGFRWERPGIRQRVAATGHGYVREGRRLAFLRAGRELGVARSAVLSTTSSTPNPNLGQEARNA